MANLIPMPWLGQPADPAGSLGRGVQTGTTLRRNWQADRLFGLQEQALRLKGKIEEHQLDEVERMLSVRERNTTAFGELSKMISDSVASGKADDPALALNVSGLLARNPSLLEEERTGRLMDFFQKSLMLRQKEKELQQKMGLPADLLAQRAKELGLEPSGLDEQGNPTFARPRVDAATTATPGAFQKDIEFLKGFGVEITPEQAKKYYEAKTFGQAGRDVEPQVKVIEGQKFIVNPKTGSVHRLDPMVSRSRFIADNVSRWVSDGLAKDENEAAAKLGAFYDQHISQSVPQTTDAAPAAVKTIGGFKVRVIKP